MIKVTTSGSFKNLENFANAVVKGDIYDSLAAYGEVGVNALASETPVDSRLSSLSWYYRVEKKKGAWQVSWHNDNVTRDGVPIVILLQYGHGTGTGGYVQGQDFINPALRPIFDKISDGVWKAVTSK